MKKSSDAGPRTASACNSPRISRRQNPAACVARCGAFGLFTALLLFLLPAAVQAQFTYTTNDGTLTITGYNGSGGAVTIPNAIDGLPVTGIGRMAFSQKATVTSISIPNSVASLGDFAFIACTNLTNVSLGSGVTNLGNQAFDLCASLTAIKVDAQNPAYSDLDGVVFNKGHDTLVQFAVGRAGGYAIPPGVTSIGDFAFCRCRNLTGVTVNDSVTNIGDYAFFLCSRLAGVKLGTRVAGLGYMAFNSCASLTNITIPDGVSGIKDQTFSDCASLAGVTIGDGVTSIGEGAFSGCSNLTSATIGIGVTNIGEVAFVDCTSLRSVYFRSNAPTLGLHAFLGDTNATFYYLPGTAGWSPTLGGRPAVLWNPAIQYAGGNFGVRTNQFGFDITGTCNLVIVVEASTNLADSSWTVVGTNLLTGGSSCFLDPQWTNQPARFYRLRSP